MRIVALDPGQTTGWASYDSNFAIPDDAWCQEQLWGEHHTILWSQLHEAEPDVVITERFTYQRRDKVVLKSVEYIGVARLYCQSTDTPLVEQTPSQAKNLWTDDKLRKLCLWIPSAPHAMDATRHLLYYLVVGLGDRSWLTPLR